MSELTKETAQEMVVYLRGLASGKTLPQDSGEGLCSNFKMKFDIRIQSLVCFQNFPEYSGNKGFPIKSPNKKRDSLEEYYSNANLWIGEYGDSRKRFCAWCAYEIEIDYIQNSSKVLK